MNIKMDIFVDIQLCCFVTITYLKVSIESQSVTQMHKIIMVVRCEETDSNIGGTLHLLRPRPAPASVCPHSTSTPSITTDCIAASIQVSSPDTPCLYTALHTSKQLQLALVSSSQYSLCSQYTSVLSRHTLPLPSSKQLYTPLVSSIISVHMCKVRQTLLQILNVRSESKSRRVISHPSILSTMISLYIGQYPYPYPGHVFNLK